MQNLNNNPYRLRYSDKYVFGKFEYLSFWWRKELYWNPIMLIIYHNRVSLSHIIDK